MTYQTWLSVTCYVLVMMRNLRPRIWWNEILNRDPVRVEQGGVVPRTPRVGRQHGSRDREDVRGDIQLIMIRAHFTVHQKYLRSMKICNKEGIYNVVSDWKINYGSLSRTWWQLKCTSVFFYKNSVFYSQKLLFFCRFGRLKMTLCIFLGDRVYVFPYRIC